MDLTALTNKLLSLVNDARGKVQCESLELNMSASDVAQDHATMMAADGYIGNFSLQGEPPTERYFMAGITSFSSENVGGLIAPSEGKPFAETPANAEKLALKVFKEQFLNDPEAKARMLAEELTMIGIGVHLEEGQFRMVHAYCACHLEVNEISEDWARQGTLISGRIISKKYKLYGAVLRGDTSARENLTPEEASAQPRMQPCGQPVMEVRASQISVNEDNAFSFALDFQDRLPMGYYVLHLYVADWKKKRIVYGSDADEGSSADSFPDSSALLAESIVMMHPYGLPMLRPITGVWIVSGQDKKPAAGGDTKEPSKEPAKIEDEVGLDDDDDLAPAQVVPPGAQSRSYRAAPAGYKGRHFRFCYERDSDPDATTPAICELIIIKGKTPQMNPPVGFELIPVNLTPDPPQGKSKPNFTFMCTRSINPLPETEVVVEMLLVWGAPLEGYEVLELPFGGDGEAGVASLCYRKALIEEDLAASDQLAEESKLAEDARERALMAAQQAKRERLRTELERLQRENGRFTSKLALVMANRHHQDVHAKHEGSNAAGGQDKGNTLMETERRYLKNLQAWAELTTSLQQQTQENNRMAMELQLRLDDKEAKGNQIETSFADFKKEIALAAENSRTGKPIGQKMVRQFEIAEKRKDEDVEKVRITNIKFRMHLRKLEKALKEKEQLAEGLHLIDFEQLKIENQTLNEKIEERNEELHKFRKKTTTTVQVLTHIKEKLQFVDVERQLLQQDLAALDAKMSKERESLTQLKHERDSLRLENERLDSQQGFASSALLVQDFEARKEKIASLREEIEGLKNKHKRLLQATRTSAPAPPPTEM